MENLRIRVAWVFVALCLVALAGCGRAVDAEVDDLEVPDNAVARVVLFAADDCAICDELIEGLIAPLQERCGAALELKTVDIGTTAGYEAFVAAEVLLVGEAGRWEVPTVVVEDTAFVGEEAIRANLLDYLKCVFGAGGNDWPAGDALSGINAQPAPARAVDASPFGGTADDAVESCIDDKASAVCASPAPIFVLYLSGSDCTDTCERTRYDLIYLEGVFPQLSFEERPSEENYGLADALGEQLGVPEDQRRLAPAVVVGEDYLVGDELVLDNLRARVAAYAESGAMALWYLIDLP
ncbi:MAG: hypothetical protein J7M39_02825 [Anaerolineae bacterium]|nr:hypothetical protein [Anaerolineae bacterium]